MITMRHHIAGYGILFTAVLALGGCQGGVASPVKNDGDATGELLGTDNGSLAVATSSFILLDLETGTVTTRAVLPDQTTNADYQTRTMVFRRVAGSGKDFFLGTAEVTQAQWSRLVATTDSAAVKTPWSSVLGLGIVDTAGTSAGSSPAQGNAMPAFNMSYTTAETVVNGFNTRKATRLGFPTATQWRFACDANAAATFSWGEDMDRATVAPRAAVSQTQDGVKGPRTVYGRLPNGFGFFDMHGNVWEWVQGGGSAVGGSWFDGLALARTANQIGSAEGVVDTEGHPLIGLRLTIQP